MPVSSPSYFPPNRSNGTIVGLTAGNNTTGARNFLAGLNAGKGSTSSDLIIIGDSSGNAGITGMSGAIILGSACAQSFYGTSNTAPGDPPVILGYKVAQNVASADACVIVGCNNFRQLTAGTGGTPLGHSQSVIIGSQILNGANALTNPQSVIAASVIIGNSFYTNNTYWSGIASAIIIGQNIGNTNFSNSLNSVVVIGTGACASGIPTHSVIIGTAALANHVKGAGAGTIIAIGDGAGPNVLDASSSSSIYIGRNAGTGFPNDVNQIVLIPQAVGSSYESYIAAKGVNADATKANIGLGGTTYANSNLALTGAKNIVCLYAGIVGSANPINGGYFYVTGTNNDVHWVGSDGVDTNIVAGANGALTYTYNAPLTGFAITIGNDIAQLILEPAGTLAAGTVTLPAAPENGDTVGISTTQTITALTISPNAGQTVADAPTTLGVGGAVRFLYRATNTTWYRIGN